MVEMTAYCGLNCEECKAFKATRAEDIRWKEQIAKHWSDQGEIKFKPECIMACPARATEPYKLKVDRCMVFSSENPRSRLVPKETRDLEKRLVKRPTPNSILECSTCLEACPIGKLD